MQTAVETGTRDSQITNIIAAIRKGIRKGQRLYFVGDPKTATYDYYSSYREARAAIKYQRAIYHAEGCFVKCVTDYDEGKLEEIDLKELIGWLKKGMNPFEYLYYSYSDYPYEWLKQIYELYSPVER